MGIMQMIERKKQQFFSAQGGDKVEIMKAERERLAKERSQMEKYEKERVALAKEKEKIHDLKMAPKRERRAKVSKGINRFMEASGKAKQVMKNIDKGVSRFSPGSVDREKSMGIKPSGIFTEKSKKAEKKRGRTVVINIKE